MRRACGGTLFSAICLFTAWPAGGAGIVLSALQHIPMRPTATTGRRPCIHGSKDHPSASVPCELALEHHDSSFQRYVLGQRDLQSPDQVHNCGRKTKNEGGLHVTRFKTTIGVTTASVLTWRSSRRRPSVTRSKATGDTSASEHSSIIVRCGIAARPALPNHSQRSSTSRTAASLMGFTMYLSKPDARACSRAGWSPSPVNAISLIC
jgi:hypothetical protein